MNKPAKAVKLNQSVERVLRILEVMAEGGGAARLQDIAGAVGLPASTALRFISTLMVEGYAEQDPETLRYSLTFRLCRIAEQIRRGHQLRDIVHPELERLARACGESACLAVEEAGEVVYVDVAEGPESILKTLQRIGKKAPLHSTGVGKTLLLDRTDEELKALGGSAGLVPLTPHTIVSRDRLLEELRQVRREGFAIDDEECELGVRCVAAPVRDHTGRVVCSISVSGPVNRMTDSALKAAGKAVRASAQTLSRRLGCPE